jgi:hypothetical protein
MGYELYTGFLKINSKKLGKSKNFRKYILFGIFKGDQGLQKLPASGVGNFL